MDRPTSYRNLNNLSNSQLTNIVIPIDNITWGQPGYIALPKFISLINVDNKIEINTHTISEIEANVEYLPFDNFDISINYVPDKPDKLLFSVTDDYLYVWNKKRWKRIPLNSF